MGRTSAPGGSRRSPRRQGSRPGHPQRARPLALDSPPLRVVGKAQPWLRAAPAEDDVRTQGGVLGIGRWPHAKVAPRPSAEARRPRGPTPPRVYRPKCGARAWAGTRYSSRTCSTICPRTTQDDRAL